LLPKFGDANLTITEQSISAIAARDTS